MPAGRGSSLTERRYKVTASSHVSCSAAQRSNAFAPHDGRGINGVFAVRDGGDVEDRIRLGQGAITGVVAERAFVAGAWDFERINRRHAGI